VYNKFIFTCLCVLFPKKNIVICMVYQNYIKMSLVISFLCVYASLENFNRTVAMLQFSALPKHKYSKITCGHSDINSVLQKVL